MNRFYKIITAVLIALIFTTGCSDEFLNEPGDTSGVSSDLIFSSRSTAEAHMAGILRVFRGQYTATDAAGVNSLFFARSVKGNDLIQAVNWFTYDYEQINREPTYRRTGFTWNYCYDLIAQCNIFISGVEASAKISDFDKKELLGQAYAMRAFFYHQLVLEFAPTYMADKNYPAPPIYTEISKTGKPMSTVSEMYDFIISDLTKAVSYLPETRIGKSYVNKSVANAILSQVYLVTNNWQGAETAAIAAYGGVPSAVLNRSSYASGFADYSNVEWLWGSPQSDDQSSYYYLAPHVMTDHSQQTYLATYVNNDFVTKFTSTDVRKLFVRKSSGLSLPDYRYWWTSKFKFSFKAHNPIIRHAELILIDAEAKYRQGKETEARNVLFSLQKNRDASAVISANTGTLLLDEILLERRKELYGEVGVEWFDAKRNRTPILRTGNHRIFTSLTADDKRFILKVPQAELDANPFIDESVNANR
jgi:hypothetical protein